MTRVTSRQDGRHGRRRGSRVLALMAVSVLTMACGSTIAGTALPVANVPVSGGLVGSSSEVHPFPDPSAPAASASPAPVPSAESVGPVVSADPTVPAGSSVAPGLSEPADSSAPADSTPTYLPTVAPTIAASKMPTVAGAFGTKPALTYPGATPAAGLQRRILKTGTGVTVAKGDYLVTSYLGQIWNGKVFDNSYDRSSTSTFQIGVGKVIPGWDAGLVGMKAGSRILLSIPPADGYGSAGSPDAGISGRDTIVYVIDIVSIIPSTATGQINAVPQPVPAGLPTVSGALGHEPTITIPKGLAEPTSSSVHLLARGTGAPAKVGTILVQLVVTDWTRTQTQSTWPVPGQPVDPSATGLQTITVDATGTLKGLIGVPLGSRALVVIAASTDPASGQSSATAVAVVDLVAQG